jgi:hypothetical protein
MPAAPTRTRPALAAVALVAACCAAAPAPAGAQVDLTWAREATSIAAPWPGLQEPDGHFRDYILARDPSNGRDDYGDPMLGYAVLLTAARTGDTDLADSGLRGLERSLGQPARSPSTRVFHNLAVVSAYNLARTRFADHPVFERARPAWEQYIRQIEPLRLRGGQRVTNKSIVEAVVLLETARSGLAADPTATTALVRGFLAKDLPAAAKPFERGGRAILGDLPLLPPAYHGLAVGMLGRAIELLGDGAPKAARRLLTKATDASVEATAPNGDVAYYGRSQLTAWTLTLTAYGAEVAAAQPDAGAQAPTYRGLARLTALRLLDYKSGPEGFLFTPALGQGIDAAIPGLDEYVAGTSYVGLTLATLEWALAASTDGKIGPVAGGVTVHGTGRGAWATVETPDLWFAVRPARTSLRDLRYDFGLVGLQVLDGGYWEDAVPARPRTVAGNDTAGPVLTHAGASAGPEATSLAPRKGGGVTAAGGFRKDSGAWLRRGVRFDFVPVGCGVRLTFPVKAGDRFSYSAFFEAKPSKTARTVFDGDQKVIASRAASVSIERGYSSGSDVDVYRARLRFRMAGRDGTITITTCARFP